MMQSKLDPFFSNEEEYNVINSLEDIISNTNIYTYDNNTQSQIFQNYNKGSGFEKYIYDEIKDKLSDDYKLFTQLNTGIYRLDGVIVKNNDSRTLNLLRGFRIEELNREQREFYILELKNFNKGRISIDEFYKHYGINLMLNPEKYIFVLNKGNQSKEKLATHRIIREQFDIIRVDEDKAVANKPNGINNDIKTIVRGAITYAAIERFKEISSLEELVVQMKLDSKGLAKAISYVDLFGINVVLTMRSIRNLENYFNAIRYINDKYNAKIYLSSGMMRGRRIEAPKVNRNESKEKWWEDANNIYGHYILTNVLRLDEIPEGAIFTLT